VTLRARVAVSGMRASTEVATGRMADANAPCAARQKYALQRPSETARAKTASALPARPMSRIGLGPWRSDAAPHAGENTTTESM
jgi:hypothetical protein